MFRKMKNIVEEAKSYIETKKDLVKMKAADAVSESAGNAVAYITLAVVGLITLLFFSVSLALGLGWALGNNFWGFLIVTVIYVGTGAGIWFNKEKMFRLPILNALLKSFFNKGEVDHGRSERDRAA
jgi:hypothetical protein